MSSLEGQFIQWQNVSICPEYVLVRGRWQQFTGILWQEIVPSQTFCFWRLWIIRLRSVQFDLLIPRIATHYAGYLCHCFGKRWWCWVFVNLTIWTPQTNTHPVLLYWQEERYFSKSQITIWMDQLPLNFGCFLFLGADQLPTLHSTVLLEKHACMCMWICMYFSRDE